MEDSTLRRLHKILVMPVKELERSKFTDDNEELAIVEKIGPRIENFRQRHGRVFSFLVCNLKHGFKKKKKQGIKGFRSILNRSLWMKDPRYKECMMELSMLCQESQLSNFLDDCEDLSILLDSHSQTTQTFLSECLVENRFTKKLYSLEMDINSPCHQGL